MIDPVPRPDMIDRLLPHDRIVRVLGAVLLIGGLTLTARGRWGAFSLVSVALGIPAGLGLVLHRRWGRALGLIFFGVQGALALVLILRGTGATRNNLSLLLGAVLGGWVVYKWSD